MNNAETIQNLYQYFRDKDYESFKKICHPEMIWSQNKGFPNGKDHRGADEVIENVLKSFSKNWKSFRFNKIELIAGGDMVIVLGEYQGIHLATGKKFVSDAAHIYKFKDGKLFRFRQYTDTKTIWDAMS